MPRSGALSNSAAKTQEMLVLWHEGWTVHEIGAKFNVTGQAVSWRLGSVQDCVNADLHRENRAKRYRERRSGEAAPEMVEHMAALMQQGVPKSKIIGIMGLSERAYRALAAKVEPSIARRWRDASHSHVANKYAETDYLEALQAATRLSRGALSRAAYDQLHREHPEWPSLSSFAFRRWNTWLVIAGLPTRPRPPGIGRLRFNEAQARAAVNRVAQIYGRRFSMNEYSSQRQPSEPSAQTLSVRFGGRRWGEVFVRFAPDLPE